MSRFDSLIKLILEETDSNNEEGSDIIDAVNSIRMYRGARSGDPSKLKGPSYFISSQTFAATYGPTAPFKLSVEKPLIVNNEEWSDYANSPFNSLEDIVSSLNAKGYDSVINVRNVPSGKMYTVLLTDSNKASLIKNE